MPGNVNWVRIMRQPGSADQPEVSIEVVPSAGTTTIAIRGDLDLASVPQLHSCLTDLVNRGETQIVLDLSAVTFCDSTALGVFAGAHRRLSAIGGLIELQRPPPALRHLLAVSGLDQVLHVT